MKIVGITRFNLATLKTLRDFRLTKDKPLKEAKEFVFEKSKLDNRIQLFEDYCYPTYKMLAEQDSDSYGMILINKDLPEPYKSRIIKLCDTVPRLQVVELNDDQGVADTVRPLLEKIAGADEKIYSYRYDDDDALSKDYIKNIKRISNSNQGEIVISFNSGYSLSRMDLNEFGIYVRKYPLNAFGLGYVSNTKNLKSIFDLGSHSKIKLPTYHDTNTLGWLSTVHEMNDSRVGDMNSSTYTIDQVMSKLSDLFPQVTQKALKELSFRRQSDFIEKTLLLVKTFHKKYVALNLLDLHLVQVDNFYAPNIIPVYLDRDQKEGACLYVLIGVKKIIIENFFNKNSINFSTHKPRIEYTMDFKDNTFCVKQDGVFLSARKDKSQFDFSNICDNWERFKYY